MAELRGFAQNVWIVDGPDVRDMGFWFTTRMTVVKLSSGSLWLESPVTVSFDLLEAIQKLGPIRYLLAGTPRHVWRLAEWHTLFPEAGLWAPRRTLATLQKGGLPFAGVLRDVPEPGWAQEFDQLAFKGSPLIEEILFFHRASRTVIVGDLIQSHKPVAGKPFRNALFRIEGVTGPGGGVGLDIRLSFTNRNAARQSLAKLLSWDFDKLIMAHGPCIEQGAKPVVERAFRWLSRA